MFDLFYYKLTLRERRKFAQNIRKEFLELRDFVLNVVSITTHLSATYQVLIGFESLEDIARFFLYCELYAYYHSTGFDNFFQDLENKDIIYVEEYSGVFASYKTNVKASYLDLVSVSEFLEIMDVAEICCDLKRLVIDCFGKCKRCISYNKLADFTYNTILKDLPTNRNFFNEFLHRLRWRTVAFQSIRFPWK